MWRHVLHVQQGEAPLAKALHEGGQSHLRGVSLAMKHTLGHEGAAQGHAVGAAGQSPLAPGLHAVRLARPVKRAIDLDEALVDPRSFGPSRAAAHHTLEVRVEADLETAATDGAGEGARDVKAVEGNDGARVGPEPEHLAR